MRTVHVLNAFSLNMFDDPEGFIDFREISLDEARDLLALGYLSGVGHASTAAVFSEVLGIGIPTNRVNVTLKKGDVALVGQYRGPRLEEGATSLPAGATIVWYRVHIS